MRILRSTRPERVRPPHLNRVAEVPEVPDAIDHTPAAGSFGSIHAVGPSADTARAVAGVVHAGVGTTHRSLATTLRWRGPAVARSRTGGFGWSGRTRCQRSSPNWAQALLATIRKHPKNIIARMR